MCILHRRAEGPGNNPAVEIPLWEQGWWYLKSGVLCSQCCDVLSLVSLHFAERLAFKETFLLGDMFRDWHPYVLEWCTRKISKLEEMQCKIKTQEVVNTAAMGIVLTHAQQWGIQRKFYAQNTVMVSELFSKSVATPCFSCTFCSWE